jgi:hypothetical protein
MKTSHLGAAFAAAGPRAPGGEVVLGELVYPYNGVPFTVRVAQKVRRQHLVEQHLGAMSACHISMPHQHARLAH